MIEELKKRAEWESDRQGVRIAVVTQGSITSLRRYDWLICAINREERFIKAHPSCKNIFSDLKIEYVTK